MGQKIKLLLESVTIAVKARRLLKRSNISSNIVKAGAEKYDKGCGYALEIDGDDYFLSISILQRNGIPYSLV